MIDPAATARVLAKFHRVRQQKLAAQFEAATRLRLIGLGFLNVERVATPTFVNRRTGKVQRAKKVSSDIKGMHPRTGVTVLCECKRYPDGLPFSALRPHQVTRLNECADANGIALLSWGGEGFAHLLDWRLLRAAGFRKQTTITAAMVAAATYRHT
jgi:hypothetical protein